MRLYRKKLAPITRDKVSPIPVKMLDEPWMQNQISVCIVKGLEGAVVSLGFVHFIPAQNYSCNLNMNPSIQMAAVRIEGRLDRSSGL